MPPAYHRALAFGTDPDTRPQCWVCGGEVDMGERACAGCALEARARRRPRAHAPERLQATPRGGLCGCDDCRARRGPVDPERHWKDQHGWARRGR